MVQALSFYLILPFLDIWEAIHHFLNVGGPVLYLICGVTFMMWILILERVWYYQTGCGLDIQSVVSIWQLRGDQTSWYAKAIRNKLRSKVYIKIEQNLRLIKTLIMLCPLFGLLGTVSGMIDVFTILSITGGDDARTMSAGVSRATIPTLAGMVAALSGIFINIYLVKKAAYQRQLIREYLNY